MVAFTEMNDWQKRHVTLADTRKNERKAFKIGQRGMMAIVKVEGLKLLVTAAFGVAGYASSAHVPGFPEKDAQQAAAIAAAAAFSLVQLVVQGRRYLSHLETMRANATEDDGAEAGATAKPNDTASLLGGSDAVTSGGTFQAPGTIDFADGSEAPAQSESGEFGVPQTSYTAISGAAYKIIKREKALKIVVELMTTAALGYGLYLAALQSQTTMHDAIYSRETQHTSHGVGDYSVLISGLVGASVGTQLGAGMLDMAISWCAETLASKGHPGVMRVMGVS